MDNISSRPLVYTISVLLPAAYLIGLIFTLKTHSHIYDIHISEGQTQVDAGISQPTAEATGAHPLAANSCINSSIGATSQVVGTGLWFTESEWNFLNVGRNLKLSHIDACKDTRGGNLLNSGVGYTF